MRGRTCATDHMHTRPQTSETFTKHPAILEAATLLLILISAMAFGGWTRLSRTLYPESGKSRTPFTNIAHSSAAAYPLPEDWEITSVAVGGAPVDTIITITSRGSSASLYLYHKSKSCGPLTSAGITNSFMACMPPGLQPRAAAAIKQLLARVRHNDTTYFFNNPLLRKRETRTGYILKKHLFNPVTSLAAAAILLLITIPHTLPSVSTGPGRRALLAALLICAAGAALRSYTSPGAPIHCNTHGIREVRSYLLPESAAEPLERYGHIFPRVMHLALDSSHNTEQNIFRTNIIFGALASLAFFLLALTIFRAPIPALFAQACFTFSPSQIWLSGTETQIPLYSLASFLGLALAIHSVRKTNPAMFWAAAATLIFASALRVETLTLLPAAAVTLAYTAHRSRTTHLRPMLTRAAAAAAIALPAVLCYISTIGIIKPGSTSGASDPAEILASIASNHNILFDPTLTPAAIPILAALAVPILLKRNKPAAAAAAALFLILVPITFSVVDCRTTALRYQAQTHWTFYLLASWLLAPSTLPPRLIKSATAAAFILLAATAAPGIILLSKGNEESAEYNFQRAATRQIPPGTNIHLPVTGPDAGRIITDFPDYMRSLHTIKGAPRPGARGLVYIGLDCYRYDKPSELNSLFTPARIRRQCASACGDREMFPLLTTTLDARTPPIGYQKRFFNISVPNPSIGFHRCGNTPPDPHQKIPISN